MSKSKFNYTIYIKASSTKIWEALTNNTHVKKYWFNATHESTWKKNAPWQLVFDDGDLADSGKILDVKKGSLLKIKWRNNWDKNLHAEGFSTCTITLEKAGQGTKVTVDHTMNRPKSKFIEAVSGGWPMILSNLKTLVETGKAFRLK